MFPCVHKSQSSEGTDAHSFDRHDPYSANDVFLIVYVLCVDALSVEHTYLIMQQVTAVGVLEEVALQL